MKKLSSNKIQKILNPISWLKLIRFKKLLEKKGIFAKLLNYFASVILRIVYKFRTLIRILNVFRNSIDIENIDQFWIIRIGFLKRRNFLPYINLDPYVSNLMDCFFTQMPIFCSNLWSIPIQEESCQIINIKHFFRYLNIKYLDKVIIKWHKILIPGGKLGISLKLGKESKNINKLKEALVRNDFYINEIDEFDLEINGNITISAIKQNKRNIPDSKTLTQKNKEILRILDQNKEILQNKTNLCVLGYQSKEYERFFDQLGLGTKEFYFSDSHIALTEISDNTIDLLIIQNYFEYCNPKEITETLNDVKRLLKKNSPIIIIIPEKKYYFSSETTHLFEKSMILQYIDDSNLLLEWITLSSSFKMIQILIKNQNYFPIQKIDKKIVLLGNYTLRYSYLINARWDAQARAFERLGYDILILDIKDNSFHYILKRIKLFKPDILWTGGKFVIEFLKKNREFFEKSKIKVINWLWDVRTPVPFNFKNLIDYMFVTTKADIPKYKQAYNIDKVYWMPASVTPEIIQRNNHIKEIYDIGFAGSLDRGFHKKRTEIVEFIQQHFNIKIFKNIYNNLPEYYSQCKIVLGGSPDQKDLELYMSNRIFVSMACGCCFLTNDFKGLRYLAENEKHLLWYDNKKDLSALITKYLYSKPLRKAIGKNARKLAEDKHNYLNRIKNMLDIIDGKTKSFYGFLE